MTSPYRIDDWDAYREDDYFTYSSGLFNTAPIPQEAFSQTFIDPALLTRQPTQEAAGASFYNSITPEDQTADYRQQQLVTPPATPALRSMDFSEQLNTNVPQDSWAAVFDFDHFPTNQPAEFVNGDIWAQNPPAAEMTSSSQAQDPLTPTSLPAPFDPDLVDLEPLETDGQHPIFDEDLFTQSSVTEEAEYDPDIAKHFGFSPTTSVQQNMQHTMLRLSPPVDHQTYPGAGQYNTIPSQVPAFQVPQQYETIPGQVPAFQTPHQYHMIPGQAPVFHAPHPNLTAVPLTAQMHGTPLVHSGAPPDAQMMQHVDHRVSPTGMAHHHPLRKESSSPGHPSGPMPSDRPLNNVSRPVGALPMDPRNNATPPRHSPTTRQTATLGPFPIPFNPSPSKVEKKRGRPKGSKTQRPELDEHGNLVARWAGQQLTTDNNYHDAYCGIRVRDQAGNNPRMATNEGRHRIRQRRQ